jgi:hypothetical protein
MPGFSIQKNSNPSTLCLSSTFFATLTVAVSVRQRKETNETLRNVVTTQILFIINLNVRHTFQCEVDILPIFAGSINNQTNPL